MKRVITIIMLTISLSCYSQQEPQFTQFWNNYSLYNPANTASGNEIISFRSNYRTRCVNSGIQPQLFSVNYENKIEKINSGGGLGYSFEKTNLLKSQKMYLSYAYHLKLPKINGSISLGFSTDYNVLQFISNWNGPNTGYNDILDPTLPKGASQGKLNVNSGLLFKTRKLEVGISLTQINEPRFDKLNFTNAKHVFGVVSYKIQLVKDLVYKPAIYFKSDFVVGVIELNSQFVLKEKYFLGLMYRVENAVGIQLGATLFNNFQIAYAYDLLTSPLTQYAKGGYHEVALTFKIK